MQHQTCRVTEIFYSLQGETTLVGLPTIFVRLTGCPLRCQYCDTSYAFRGGETLSIVEIMQAVRRYATPHVTVTGGEPLAQPACLSLLTTLCDDGKLVSLETSGALSIKDVDQRVIKILDIKTPGSAEANRQDWENLSWLSEKDQVKFVICDRQDFDWAVDIVEQYQLLDRVTVLFSPSFEQLDAKLLADWLLSIQLPIRMQIQLHKYLWGDKPGC